MSDQILEAIAGAGEATDFAPNLEPGDHLVCLTLTEMRTTREYGKKIDVEYKIIESTVHKPGETRGDVFFIQKNGDAGLYSRKRANAFSREVVKSLGGDPDDQNLVDFNGKKMKKGEVVVIQTLNKLLDKTQPGKGLLLRVSTKKRMNKDKTKEHANNTYSSVTQTKEDMGKRRAVIESGPIAAAPAASSPSPVASTPAPAPAQTTTAASVNIDGLF